MSSNSPQLLYNKFIKMKQIPLKWNVKINYEKLFNFNKLIITLTRFNIHPYFNTKKQIQDRFQ